MADHCCPQLSFDLSERRRRQNDATIQDTLKLNKTIPSAKSTECKLKIRSLPTNHLMVMGVHDAAHAKHKCDRTKNIFNSELEREDQESGAQKFGCSDKQYRNVHGTAGLEENIVEPHDDGRSFFERLRGGF